MVRAQTVEEWELGIPPDPVSRSGLKDLFRAISMMVFNTCATTQPMTPLINT